MPGFSTLGHRKTPFPLGIVGNGSSIPSELVDRTMNLAQKCINLDIQLFYFQMPASR
jgi:hypothetical protein